MHFDSYYGLLLSVILSLGPADVFVLREAVPVCRRSEQMLILFWAVLSSVDLEIYIDGGIFVYFLSK